MRSAHILSALLAAAPLAHAQQPVNLIPNWNFSDPTPLKSWRYDFPYQDWYKKNAGYVSEVTIAGKKCALLSLPPGVAGNEGGKIETALVPCEPGATYLAEVESYLPELASKIHAEVFAVDPRDQAVREAAEAQGVRLTIQRIPPFDGKPALVMIYRAQFPDPPGGAKWANTKREFTIPYEWPMGTDKKTLLKPAYISIKAYTFGATMGAGKSYFTNFKLTKLDVHRTPPVAGGVNGTWSNEAGQQPTEREIPLAPNKQPAPKKKEVAPLENIKDAFK